jgi:hypothetical protein
MIEGGLMDPAVRRFIRAYFAEEQTNDRPAMRTSLHNSDLEHREKIRDGLAELIRTRSLSPDEFWELTFVEYPDEDALYKEIEDAYEFLFGAGA